jgi:fatty acid desaturase
MCLSQQTEVQHHKSTQKDYADQEGKEAVEKSKKGKESGRHRKNEVWRFSKVFSLQAC